MYFMYLYVYIYTHTHIGIYITVLGKGQLLLLLCYSSQFPFCFRIIFRSTKEYAQLKSKLFEGRYHTFKSSVNGV